MKKKFVIGISGPSGAGKTTIGKKLAKKLKAKLINLDDYWKYHNTKINLKKDWKKLEHPSSTDFNKLYNDIIKSKEDSKQKNLFLLKDFICFITKRYAIFLIYVFI